MYTQKDVYTCGSIQPNDRSLDPPDGYWESNQGIAILGEAQDYNEIISNVGKVNHPRSKTEVPIKLGLQTN